MPRSRLLPLVVLLPLAACNGAHKKPPTTTLPPATPATTAASTPAPAPATDAVAPPVPAQAPEATAAAPAQNAAAPAAETPPTSPPSTEATAAQTPAAQNPAAAPESAPAAPTPPPPPEQAAAVPTPEPPPAPVVPSPPADPLAATRAAEAQRHDKDAADIGAFDENRAQRDAQWAVYRDQVAQLQAKRQAGSTDLMGPWQQAQAALASLDSSLQQLAGLDKTLAADEQAAKDSAQSLTAQAAQPGALRVDLAQLADQATQDAAATHALRPRVVIALNEQVDMVKAERANLPTLLQPAAPGDVHAPAAATVAAAAPPPPASIGPPKLIVKPTQSPAEYEPALYRVAAQALDQSKTSRAVVVAIEPGTGQPTAHKIAVANVRHLAQAVGRALIEDGFDAERVSIVVHTDANATDGQVRVSIAP